MDNLSFRELEASDVEVRVSRCTDKGATLLLYKDARCDMRILDEAVGAQGWECSYTETKGNLFCQVSINCDGTWVHKQDVGVPSNMEGEKGEASDAFKRACFKWGIGRELYTAPFIYVGSDKCTIYKKGNGKFACNDRFSVSAMKVKDGKIVDLTIKNDSTGKIVWPAKQNKKPSPFENIKKLKAEALELGITEEGMRSWIDATYDARPLIALNKTELKEVEKYIAGLIADKRELNNESA